jgi:hypothetical protein
MSVHIERLSLRLPPGYGPRAAAIGRGVAEGIAQLAIGESRSLPVLRLEPIHISGTASDAHIIQSVLRQVARALELQA